MSNRTWDKDSIIEAIILWTWMYGAPPAATDWNPAQAKYLGHPERAERFYKRSEDGRLLFPYLTTVRHHFGSWNAALEAAGCEPVKVGRYARRRGYKQGERRQ